MPTINIDASFDGSTLRLKSNKFDIPINMLDFVNKNGKKFLSRKQRKGATVTWEGKKVGIIKEANFAFLEKKVLFISPADKSTITLRGDFSKLVEFFDIPAFESSGWKAHLTNIEYESVQKESVIKTEKIVEKVLKEDDSEVKSIVISSSIKNKTIAALKNFQQSAEKLSSILDDLNEDVNTNPGSWQFGLENFPEMEEYEGFFDEYTTEIKNWVNTFIKELNTAKTK